MYAVTLIGGSAPFREAILTACGLTEGLTDVPVERLRPQREITAVYCDCDERWSELEQLAESDATKTLAILANLDVQEYAKALVAGVDGVVHADTTSAMIAHVILSATIGETILPKFVARSLAAQAQSVPVPMELTDYDRQLLTELCDGARISDLAERHAYSERTIRRQVQNMYLTINVTSRAQAITFAVRSGLC